MTARVESVVVGLAWGGIVFCLGIGIVTALAAPRPVDPWAGTYNCQGVGFDGRTYADVRMVVEAEGADGVYRIVQETPNGETVFGIGLSDDARLAVAYAPARSLAVALYMQEGRSVLVARWSSYGAPEGRTSTETCRRRSGI